MDLHGLTAPLVFAVSLELLAESDADIAEREHVDLLTVLKQYVSKKLGIPASNLVAVEHGAGA